MDSVPDLPSKSFHSYNYYCNAYIVTSSSVVVSPPPPPLLPIRKNTVPKQMWNHHNTYPIPTHRKRSHSVHHHNKDDDPSADTDTRKNTTTDDHHHDNIWLSRRSTIDPILVSTDIFAILIACQLMGLTDVLNDSSFWSHGGWFQPVRLLPSLVTGTTSTSTLPMFVQRVARDTVCYLFITSLFHKGNYEMTSTALESPLSILRSTLSSITTFTLARLGTLVITILVLSQPESSTVDGVGSLPEYADELLEMLRESYFLAITIASGRLGLYQWWWN